MKRTYIVPRMMCANCQKKVEKRLNRVRNISYTIDLANKSVIVYFNGEVDDSRVINAIMRAGYEAHRL
ncbi:MAG TPA: heavy metal-associated domain-containing protein [Bacilli bacterium]|nr:heavy metal-associated domain-containing protein [Bacilli bacterium]